MITKHKNCSQAPKSLPVVGAGFSLVELMIAMVLGVIIIGGCLSIFSGTLRSSEFNQALTSLQNNAQFALGMIGRDVRAAGFIGCAASSEAELSLSTSNAPTDNITASAIAVAVVGKNKNAWTPSLPKDFNPPTAIGNPVIGSHALSVQYARHPGAALSTSMNSRTDPLLLAGALDAPVSAGDLMVVSNCTRADLFEVDSVSGANASQSITPQGNFDRPFKVSADYPQNTRVMHFASNIYYIGDTQRETASGDPVYALYRQSYPYTTANPPLELIEGVDQMIFELGVRQASGKVAYVQADESGYDAGATEIVRVGLLMASLETFSDVDPSRVYTLAGRAVAPSSANASTATYPADKRLRVPFNATFNIRNRNL